MNARYAQNGIVTASTSCHGPGGGASVGRSLTAHCDNRSSALAGPNRVRAATDEIMELYRPLICGSPKHHAPARFDPQRSTGEVNGGCGRECLIGSKSPVSRLAGGTRP